MAKLNDKARLNVRTAPSVAKSIKQLVLDLEFAGVMFRGGTITIEGVMGAIALDFSRKDYKEVQLPLLKERLKELEVLIESELADEVVPEMIRQEPIIDTNKKRKRS